MEDTIADYLELQTVTAAVLTKEVVESHRGGQGDRFDAAFKLAKMVGLYAGIAADAGFARQMRRKLV